MKITRTVRIKLDVPPERRTDLHQTISQFTRAANYTVDHGRDDDGDLILTKTALHDAVYYDLRDVTDLPANLCVRAYSKALAAMKSTVSDWQNGISRPLPTFDEGTVVYDKRTLTIKDRSATLATINGRVTVQFVLGEYQRQYLDDDAYEKRMGTLRYRADDDTFYLHVVIQKEVEERNGDRVLGVDVNLKNVAVTSTGRFFDGGRLLWGTNHYFRVRRSLQDKGTRSARQALRRVSGRENRFVLDRLHNISRGIVDEARQHDCAYIAIEDLTDIQDRIDATGKRLKRQLHHWAFRKLHNQIEYKAAAYGIRVEAVDPAYTSQTCSKCGHQSRTNRDSQTGWFVCTACGYEVDGDYNAAKNVGLQLLALPEGERPSGLGNGQLALTSGALNVNDTASVYSSLEFEREPTDKPTSSE